MCTGTLQLSLETSPTGGVRRTSCSSPPPPPPSPASSPSSSVSSPPPDFSEETLVDSRALSCHNISSSRDRRDIVLRVHCSDEYAKYTFKTIFDYIRHGSFKTSFHSLWEWQTMCMGNGEVWHNLPILDCFSSGKFVGVTEN